VYVKGKKPQDIFLWGAGKLTAFEKIKSSDQSLRKPKIGSHRGGPGHGARRCKVTRKGCRSPLFATGGVVLRRSQGAKIYWLREARDHGIRKRNPPRNIGRGHREGPDPQKKKEPSVTEEKQDGSCRERCGKKERRQSATPSNEDP